MSQAGGPSAAQTSASGYGLQAVKDIASLAKARESQKIGDLVKLESNVEAKQLQLQATQREADRMERLQRALASQNARAGAAGIRAYEGSPLTIAQTDIERAETATERDRFMTDLASMTAKRRGRIKQRAAKTDTLFTLIEDLGLDERLN